MKKILSIFILVLLAGPSVSVIPAVFAADNNTPVANACTDGGKSYDSSGTYDNGNPKCGGYSCTQPDGTKKDGGIYQADDTKNPPAYKKGDPIPCSIAGQVADKAGFDLKDIFGWAIGIGSIVALGVITFGGTKYAASGLFGEHASSEQVSQAKEWIWAGLKGLALLIAAYLILNTINPNILIF